MNEKTETTGYIPRLVDKKIESLLKQLGGVCIYGPRGCGKTETARRICESEILLDSPDDDHHARRLADMAWYKVLEGDTPRLIDEWQNVPKVWDSARREVDSRARPGQFVFTSSASPLGLKTQHTGIGRITHLRMRTMSLYETGDSSGKVSLESVCEGEARDADTGDVSLDDLARFIVRGGWPETVAHEADSHAVLSSYISGLTDGYAGEVDGIRYDGGKMRETLSALATCEGLTAGVPAVQRLAAGGGRKTEPVGRPIMNGRTVTGYLNLFERLYVTENTPPYTPYISSPAGIRRDEERHLCDVSLACALLGVTEGDLISDLSLFETMFKSLCVHDLKVYADSFRAEVFYYRDYHGKGIDAVVKLPDWRWCAFDIRLAPSDTDAACASLLRTVRGIEKKGGDPPSAVCLISGLTDAAYLRRDGVYVVPLTALRP